MPQPFSFANLTPLIILDGSSAKITDGQDVHLMILFFKSSKPLFVKSYNASWLIFQYKALIVKSLLNASSTNVPNILLGSLSSLRYLELQVCVILISKSFKSSSFVISILAPYCDDITSTLFFASIPNRINKKYASSNPPFSLFTTMSMFLGSIPKIKSLIHPPT